MRDLKKLICDMEARLEQNRQHMYGQSCQLKTAVLQKITTPKVLLGGMAGGVLLGLLCGKRRRCDKSSGAEARPHNMLGSMESLLRLAPALSAAWVSFSAQSQQNREDDPA